MCMSTLNMVEILKSVGYSATGVAGQKVAQWLQQLKYFDETQLGDVGLYDVAEPIVSTGFEGFKTLSKDPLRVLENVAIGKKVTSTDDAPIIGDIPMITDGDKEAADGSYVELGPFIQSVTIDLGADYDIYAILLWHFHKQARVYFDVVVQVSDDPDFIMSVKTLFNNDHDNSSGLGIGSDMHYIETSEGKLIDAKGVRARYVRLYSNGNNSNELNHYIEVEVFGKAVKWNGPGKVSSSFWLWQLVQHYCAFPGLSSGLCTLTKLSTPTNSDCF